MEIYNRKSLWKIVLLIAGLVVVVITMIYSNYLAKHFRESEQERVEYFALAFKSQTTYNELLTSAEPGSKIYELVSNMDAELPAQMIQDIIVDIPVIVLDEKDEIYAARNFGKYNEDEEYLRKELEDIQENGYPPIEGEGYASKIYYKNSQYIPLLTWLPILQFFLIIAFVAVGYIGFSNARRAEQNRVWVGMAKETAHQLGTPISALIGWIEHLKYTFDKEDDEKNMIIQELQKDVGRLNLIADRFSKIGSEPERSPMLVSLLLDNVHAYMHSRTPKAIQLNFPHAYPPGLSVQVNAHLVEWVFENLIRNSIDAMSGKGKINLEVYLEKGYVCIDVSDTGKGIPSNKWKTVFQPGFTTKKRGWGLGLSLAKRIVEDYHKGKISVTKSVINAGTTITVRLPEYQS